MSLICGLCVEMTKEVVLVEYDDDINRASSKGTSTNRRMLALRSPKRLPRLDRSIGKVGTVGKLRSRSI